MQVCQLGLGFRIHGSEFRVQGFEFRVWRLGAHELHDDINAFGIPRSRFRHSAKWRMKRKRSFRPVCFLWGGLLRVKGLGFRIQGLGFRVFGGHLMVEQSSALCIVPRTRQNIKLLVWLR